MVINMRFFILIFTLRPSDSKRWRLYEAGILYPVFLRYGRRTLKVLGRRKDITLKLVRTKVPVA